MNAFIKTIEAVGGDDIRQSIEIDHEWPDLYEAYLQAKKQEAEIHALLKRLEMNRDRTDSFTEYAPVDVTDAVGLLRRIVGDAPDPVAEPVEGGYDICVVVSEGIVSEVHNIPPNSVVTVDDYDVWDQSTDKIGEDVHKVLRDPNESNIESEPFYRATFPKDDS